MLSSFYKDAVITGLELSSKEAEADVQMMKDVTSPLHHLASPL